MTNSACLLIAALFSSFFSNFVACPNLRRAKAVHADIPDDISTLPLSTNENIFQKNNFAPVYFTNLHENLPINEKGSCGYVASAMLLSFYDVYWNDSIIPSEYEINSTSPNQASSDADFKLPSFSAESPGINRFSISDAELMDSSEYLSLALDNKHVDFQARLFSEALSAFGSVPMDSEGKMGLDGSQMATLMSSYLSSVGFSKDDYSIDFCLWGDSGEEKEKAIELVESGVPIILLLSDPLSGDAHAAVAHDYDSDSGEFFVHPGWSHPSFSSVPTHVPLKALRYSKTFGSVSLSLKTAMNLGRRYIVDGSSMSAASFAFPQDVRLVSGNYADMLPTYSWQSLHREKWFRSENWTFSFSILDSSRNVLAERNGIRSAEWTLTPSEWQSARFQCLGSRYSIHVSPESAINAFLDDYWCSAEFQKPKEYLNHPYIQPDEFGYADAYPTDEKTRTDFIQHDVRGFRFKTRRYRTGYIHNEYIVMSPIRKGIHEAFLEFEFEKAIERIDVDLSHWRGLTSEHLSDKNGSASVKAFIQNEWITILSMLNDKPDLPIDRSNMNTYKIEFPQPTYKIVFVASYVGTATNESNRGRICIGNIGFYETDWDLPPSGWEIDYDPTPWDYVIFRTNCYAYALNAFVNPYPDEPGWPFAIQPGGSEDVNNYRKNDFLAPSVFLSMVAIDSINFHFGFEPIGRNEKCKEGWYKVALVFDPGHDYHWYRQNPDGTWSHKPGLNPVTNLDASGKTIFDPEKCNRVGGSTLGNYPYFYGYFEIDVREIDVHL